VPRKGILEEAKALTVMSKKRLLPKIRTLRDNFWTILNQR
jgi:hypothetical protein